MRIFCRFRTFLLKNSNLKSSKTRISSSFLCTIRTFASHLESQKMLSNKIQPVHYDLTLKPNLKAFTFDGKTKIKLRVVEETSEIVLNAVKLRISSSSLIVKGGKEVSPKETKDSEKDETVTFSFETPLKPSDEAEFEVEFSGELNDKMKGFYRSKYFVDGDDEPRFAAVTQFEATDARRCFPCFDAPEFKATFDITVIAPKKLVTLSNMPVISEFEQDGDHKVVKFDRSPIMSSYLLAIVVGEFDFIEAKSEDGVLVRVYTPLNKQNQGTYALDVAVKVLPYYKNYFNIGFPLPKLDLIAIADLACGAMENWGLITYRETLLLVDPNNTSLLKKQHIALTVGHEIAHQWFGNLVTMKWWTDLWLNEGYASFSEFLCVHFLFPEFDIWTQFVTDMYTRALDLDSLKSSHPIEVEVQHPDEIDEIFDEISYNKGACVIRMLHNYIGDEDFRKGMHLYLSRHQYGNTKTEDLWKAFAESASKPVTQVMTNWVKSVGFPVVSVTKSTQQGNKRVLSLKQERFIADGSEADEKTTWMIPISIATPKKRDALTFVFDKTTTEVEIEDVSEADWIKINPGTVGFYRTQYLPEMLEAFVTQGVIKSRVLPPLDRLGLLDDLCALIQAGKVSTVELFKLLDAYRDEDNYTVWQATCTNLHKLQLLLSHTDFSEKFNEFCVNLYTPIAKKLGWEKRKDESHLDTLLRPLVLARLISSGCEKTISEAKKIFEEQGTNVDADLRQLVYKAVMQTGNQATFDAMLKLYRNAESQEEKDRFGLAFGAIRDTAVLKKVLEFAMSGEPRSTETVRIISAAAINTAGRDLTWEFFKQNASEFQKKYEGGYLLSWMAKSLTENFASEEKAVEVEKFFKENNFPGTERTIQQAVETIRSSTKWLNRDRASIEAYLKGI
ncbi:puromycin-sensitive aminopeptidase [Culicoides brevitarsis]|uniref:puromycin-sensitive aminopeptidase n=1 Tax=Culicoides brevitarsis TaxID=469753 RepID=UPI00307BDEED